MAAGRIGYGSQWLPNIPVTIDYGSGHIRAMIRPIAAAVHAANRLHNL
jgi:hypothetical protein